MAVAGFEKARRRIAAVKAQRRSRRRSRARARISAQRVVHLRTYPVHITFA